MDEVEEMERTVFGDAREEDDNKRTYKFFVISESELPTFRATQLAKHKKKEE